MRGAGADPRCAWCLCVYGAHCRCLCLADIVKEVAIMRLLADHPNTVQLHQVRPGSRS